MGLGPFPMSPHLATPLDAMPSSPKGLQITPCVVSTLTLQYTPLPGLHLGSLLVAPVLGSPRPPGHAACRGTPSGLRCAPVTPWWGVADGSWDVGITAGLCSMITLSEQLLSATRSPPPSYSPPVSCPPEVIPKSALSTSVVLVGPPGVSASGIYYDPPTFMLPLKYMSPSTIMCAYLSFLPSMAINGCILITHWYPLWVRNRKEPPPPPLR